MMRVIKDHLPLKNLSKIEKIDYGWSTDEKYFLEDTSGSRYLLRISSIDAFEKKSKEFDRLTLFNTLSFPMSEAIEFDIKGL